jgi:penicillin-binding protein 2
VELTLDVRLQRTAEQLLQSALQRQAIAQHVAQPPSAVAKPSAAADDLHSRGRLGHTTEPAGGAIVVMDVSTGTIVAAASAPKFDPNLFAQGDNERLVALLADRASPLVNRVCQMAIPPGSTFKTLTAVALLESATVSPTERFACQGYLHEPDRQRCDIYVRQGVGHGEVTLADALAVSCNVYFFHFAELMGPRPLVQWAQRFGFGRPTGVDLPGEAAGTLPSPENIPVERISIRSNGPNGMNSVLRGRTWRTADTQSLSIGQGALTATPLQVLCMMAAVANGGRLVTPHVANRVRARTHAAGADDREDRVRASTHPTTLQVIRDGLRRVVADTKGTAHDTVYIESIAVAGKTGTAETGGDRASHAWFAGYVPAEEPKLAFVIVLEHAGDAATAAGPVAKRLVVRMEQLGLL